MNDREALEERPRRRKRPTKPVGAPMPPELLRVFLTELDTQEQELLAMNEAVQQRKRDLGEITARRDALRGAVEILRSRGLLDDEPTDA